MEQQEQATEMRPLRLQRYEATFAAADASGDSLYEASDRAEVPEDAVVVSVFDARRKRFHCQWFCLDALGPDQAIRARVVGGAILHSLERTGDAGYDVTDEDP
jgi:hypothetical protein